MLSGVHGQRHPNIRFKIIHAGNSNGNMQSAKVMIVNFDRRIRTATIAQNAHASQQQAEIGSQNHIQSFASVPDSRPSHANRVERKNVIENKTRQMTDATAKKRW